MSHRRHFLNYSEKLDTIGDTGLPETLDISELFMNYLKTQSISESECLSKSNKFLKRLQTIIILYSCYEQITFLGCLTIFIISLEFKLIYFTIGLFFKLLSLIYLIFQVRKQQKQIGFKSIIIRKILFYLIKQNKFNDIENRIEIRLMDVNIAQRLTFWLILKEFTGQHTISIINILIMTILSIVLYTKLILIESKINLYLIYSEFTLLILPFTLIILTLTLLLLFIITNSIINLINLIIRFIIHIIITFPKVLRFFLTVFKIKKENHTILKKYIHDSFTSNDNCSICLCTFQKQCILLPCQHYFHINCIEKWFFAHNSCPICRAKINNNDNNQQQ